MTTIDFDPYGGNVWQEPTTWKEWWVHNKTLALDYSGILGPNTVLEVRGGTWEGEEE